MYVLYEREHFEGKKSGQEELRRERDNLREAARGGRHGCLG